MDPSKNFRTISVPFTAVCIDDSAKPREIPVEKWVVKEKEYTVINVIKLQNGTLGFVLKEITLGDDTFPYYYFLSHRFGIIVDDMEAEDAVAELLKETDVWQNVTN